MNERSGNPLNLDDSQKRILVYDDNIEILNLCVLFFRKNHYEVKTMSRCEEVIHDVQTFKPHLILMDIWLPEIGGEKAVELLKANPETRNIPVLLFSANSDIKEICKRAHADGYVEKPFNIQEFKETIEYHIRIAQAR